MRTGGHGKTATLKHIRSQTTQSKGYNFGLCWQTPVCLINLMTGTLLTLGYGARSSPHFQLSASMENIS